MLLYAVLCCTWLAAAASITSHTPIPAATHPLLSNCPQLHPGVEAEAELLAAIVTFFQRLGLGPADVGLKVSSRKVLQVSTPSILCVHCAKLRID